MNKTNIVSAERMLLTASRLPIVEEIVKAQEEHELQHALRKLRPMVENDLEQLLYEAKKSPLAVRLPEQPLPQLLSNWKQLNKVEGSAAGELADSKYEGLCEAVHDMLLEALFRAWLRLRTRGEYRIPVVLLPAGVTYKEDYFQDLTTMVAKQVLGEEFKYCHYSVEQEESLLA